MEFKGKEQRTQCYTARDTYFQCLEKNKSSCEELFKDFEKLCGKKWVEHFIRRRQYLKFKDRIEKEGVDVIDKEKL